LTPLLNSTSSTWRADKYSKKKLFSAAFFFVLLAGFLLPERLAMPVAAATPADWNNDTFWYDPWGSSGVHKGIDIFAEEGREVRAATGGIVLFSGTLGIGGEAIAILGPKWRIHYYAHLVRRDVKRGMTVYRDTTIGAVGSTGNATGKPSHLHYAILSIVPLPWKATLETQGWRRMFYLDPNEKLRTLAMAQRQ
jgi:murein DD-endopeptidase MepM/ murein hydrolase activator NlpD